MIKASFDGNNDSVLSGLHKTVTRLAEKKYWPTFKISATLLPGGEVSE